MTGPVLVQQVCSVDHTARDISLGNWVPSCASVCSRSTAHPAKEALTALHGHSSQHGLGSCACSEYAVSIAQPRVWGLPLEASLAAHQQINCCQWISSYTERLRGTTLSLSG